MELTSAVICCGFQKCATTSLWQYLVSSNSFSYFEAKERDYFGSNEENKFNAIERDEFFRFVSHELLDVSPQYACSKAAEHIYRAEFDSIKILFICRDPIDRIISQVQQNIRRGSTINFELESLSSELDALISKYGKSTNVPIVKTITYDHINSSVVLNSCYTSVVNHYAKLFGEDNIHIFSMDNILSKPSTLHQVLGISTEKLDKFPKKNSGGSERYGVIKSLSKVGVVKGFVKYLLGKRLYQKLWWWVNTELLIDDSKKIKIDIDPLVLKKLEDFFIDEIRA